MHLLAKDDLRTKQPLMREYQNIWEQQQQQLRRWSVSSLNSRIHLRDVDPAQQEMAWRKDEHKSPKLSQRREYASIYGYLPGSHRDPG